MGDDGGKIKDEGQGHAKCWEDTRTTGEQTNNTRVKQERSE